MKAKIKTGKLYLTRDNKKVIVIAMLDEENFGCSDAITRRSSGKFTDREDSNCDFVKELEY